jgi:hypothetical protein
MFHNSFNAKQDCYKRRYYYILADQNKLIAKIQVTEQYLAKCPKRVHFPLYEIKLFSKTPFPSTLLNVNLVKYGPKNVSKKIVI